MRTKVRGGESLNEEGTDECEEDEEEEEEAKK